jgi:hypothetical protein
MGVKLMLLLRRWLPDTDSTPSGAPAVFLPPYRIVAAAFDPATLEALAGLVAGGGGGDFREQGWS